MSFGRVLVVDDEPEVGAVLRDALVAAGYSVVTALSGEEALGLVSSFKPEVVLLDVFMPRMSGDQVLERLRRDHPHIAVVIASALEDEVAARTLLTRGAFDYLRKPFDLALLERVVIAAMAHPPRGHGRDGGPPGETVPAARRRAR
jgi:CheY-like chemotaxis protein